MPDPDPHHARLVKLRHQRENLARQMLTSPVDSQERGVLDQQSNARLEQVLLLRTEPEG